MLTDNDVLITAATRNIKTFVVPTVNIPAEKIKRKYNSSQKADLDIKTSVNKIGEIVNLSQELNTLLWQNLYEGQSIFDNKELYMDICSLAVLSGIEIDAAKREYPIDSVVELKLLREKYLRKDCDNKYIKPYFFKFISEYKGFCDENHNNYKFHHCSMDLLEIEIDKTRLKNDMSETIKLLDVFEYSDFKDKNVHRNQLARIITLTQTTKKELSSIWLSHLTTQEKAILSEYVRLKSSDYIHSLKMSPHTMFKLIKLIENDKYSNIRMVIFNIIFGYPNESFYNFVKLSDKPVQELSISDDGNIEIFGEKYNIDYN